MENELKLALENGKAVIVIKNDTEILKLIVADSNEELIKEFVKEQEQVIGLNIELLMKHFY